MTAIVISPDRRPSTERPIGDAARPLRFDRLAITCVFGDPRDPRSWSGAPNNLATAFERLGVSVEGIHQSISPARKLALAAQHVLACYGRPGSTEQILRGGLAREMRAHQVAEAAQRLGIHHVLHMSTLDLPVRDSVQGVKHYLYFDQTWDLSLRHRPDAVLYSKRAINAFEQLERESLAGLEHIFTFGEYVRENLIEHYGVPSERVTSVGSGMGRIEPYFGEKNATAPSLLFVAKHLFREKGGPILLAAFDIALQRRPDLGLTIVGDARSREFVPRDPRIKFHTHLPWEDLQQLYREATLLVQPMLNDPWGQVYLEALASRTPVMGLNRNGLPEITDYGRFGFLVDEPDPAALADAIVDAIGDPARLARMGIEGQRHVLDTFSWDRVAERILFI